MSESFIDGTVGGVTLPASHYMKVSKYSFKVTRKEKVVSCFGDGEFEKNRVGQFAGAGTITGFLRAGGGATNTIGMFPATTNSASSPFENDGAALVLDVSGSNCTYTGTAVFPSTSIDVDIADPAIPVTLDYKFSGTITEAWA